MPERKSYVESCQLLQTQNLVESGKLPEIPKRMPRYDDDEIGISFFRTQLTDVALDNLTLPRTFFVGQRFAAYHFAAQTYPNPVRIGTISSRLISV